MKTKKKTEYHPDLDQYILYIPRVSLIFLYMFIESVSFMNSRTTSPCSFSTTNTSSGLAILDIITLRTFDNTGLYNCLRNGMSVWGLPINNGEVDVKGLSLYKSAANEFQYSKQILKISVSSTSDINIR